jgi:hypothetical protein
MTLPVRDGGVPVEFEPMSPEEMQRTMQFLLAQQAQFAADFEKLTVKTEGMTDAIIGLTGIVGRLADQQEHTTGIVGRIAEQQDKTDEQIRETNTQIRETHTRVDELGQYIKTVESHLNVVIEMFERHLREDHGRRPS